MRGAEAQLNAVDLEKRTAELFQHPFQVRHGNIGINRQPLDLMEHRRVGLVRVATESPPRGNETMWRLFSAHGAHLHWARMGAQQQP